MATGSVACRWVQGGLHGRGSLPALGCVGLSRFALVASLRPGASRTIASSPRPLKTPVRPQPITPPARLKPLTPRTRPGPQVLDWLTRPTVMALASHLDAAVAALLSAAVDLDCPRTARALRRLVDALLAPTAAAAGEVVDAVGVAAALGGAGGVAALAAGGGVQALAQVRGGRVRGWPRCALQRAGSCISAWGLPTRSYLLLARRKPPSGSQRQGPGGPRRLPDGARPIDRTT
jgi:hypothetical protein